MEQASAGEPQRDSAGGRRRQAVVAAAYELIAERGFEHLSTRAVAARVGINIATVHYYFKTKEDLIAGVSEYMLGIFGSAKEIERLDFSSPWATIQSLFVNLDYRWRYTPQLPTVLCELGVRAARDQIARDALTRLERAWRGYMTRVVSQGVEQGVFHRELNVEDAVTTLILVQKGITLQQVSTGSAVRIEPVLEQLATLLLARISR